MPGSNIIRIEPVNAKEFNNPVPTGKPSPGVLVELGKPNIVSLTVATKNRVPWLANSQAHRLLARVWRDATVWIVGHYTLMPDHLHLLCAPTNVEYPMEEWIAYWKREFALQHARPTWKFQSRGWHHRLRNQESYQQAWDYIRNNPIRSGLVTHAEDWPYQGCVHETLLS